MPKSKSPNHRGVRALVDRIRVTTGPVEFKEPYSDACVAMEKYVQQRLRARK